MPSPCLCIIKTPFHFHTVAVWTQINSFHYWRQLGLALLFRNPTIFSIIRWVAGSMVPSTKRWWSKNYRLKIKQWVACLDLEHSKLFIFIFFVYIVKKKKKKKNNWTDFCKELWKRIILRTSDVWLMRLWSHWHSV